IAARSPPYPGCSVVMVAVICAESSFIRGHYIPAPSRRNESWRGRLARVPPKAEAFDPRVGPSRRHGRGARATRQSRKKSLTWLANGRYIKAQLGEAFYSG